MPINHMMNLQNNWSGQEFNESVVKSRGWFGYVHERDIYYKYIWT